MLEKKLDLGRTVTTKAVAVKMKRNALFDNFVLKSLSRYQSCDWGDTCEDDCTMNELAVQSDNESIMAEYLYNEETSIFIRTEWDRSVTTIMFADEY